MIMPVSNSLTKTQPKMGLAAYLTNDAVKAQINKIVGGKDSAKFISSIISAVQATPALQSCDNSSIVSAALLGQSLNLSPSPQLANFYMVPYGNKAQFILGWKGMVQLAIRSGYYKKLNVLPIKQGELVAFDALNEEIEVNLIEDEEQRENAPTMGYYAMFEYSNGFRKALYWSKAKMEKHALTYSAGYKAKKGYTFWEKDFDAMACKTMLRQLISKWGVMSIDLQKAMDSDMAVVKEDGSKDFVDAVKVESSPVTPAPVEVEAPAPKKTIKTEVVEEPKATPTPQPQDAAAALFGQ